MKVSTFNAATSLVVSTVACTLQRVQGYYAGGVAAWLQIFDSPVQPANGTVPTKSYAMPATFAYAWVFDPGSLVLFNGCFIGVSSTEGTYTPVAYVANTTYADIEADYGPYNFQPTSYSTAGDLTTTAHALTVWADAAAGAIRKLLQVDYNNNSGAQAWLMVFASVPAAGAIPVLVLGGSNAGEAGAPTGVANGASLSQDFGDGIPISALSPVASDFPWAAPTGNALSGNEQKGHYGCYLRESSTAGTFTAIAAGTSNIRAYYV